MAYYVEIHPDNPQQRLVDKVVEHLLHGEVIALPTDSGYAIACTMANKEGLERIRTIRQVGAKHHFTLLCHNFAQLGQLVILDNAEFRLLKAATPGPYTFILRGTKDVPRMTLHPKKNTIGVRIPDHAICQAIVSSLGQPLLSSSLIMPGETDPLTEGWIVNDVLGAAIDVVVEGPVGEEGPTTVIDFSDGEPVIAREGAGDISLFE
ncbi:MAG: L-threonylcarbamoyladenylate synthase [Actinomycetaceae bacterium]|nr:threonylcarbamoyl-AMP synthase [Arcanobacterium sp.]MDD7686342.1 L-threonylcarbamoyladenylate synthase [Actinomycetaceae bacterium]MDY5274201.1 L-threonylcarbamoyladenylate synthase [Arcanobacterium sp.]